MNREMPSPFIIDQRNRSERSRSQIERSQIPIQIENSESQSWPTEIESEESDRGSCIINENINLDLQYDNCIFGVFLIH